MKRCDHLGTWDDFSLPDFFQFLGYIRELVSYLICWLAWEQQVPIIEGTGRKSGARSGYSGRFSHQTDTQQMKEHVSSLRIHRSTIMTPHSNLVFGRPQKTPVLFFEGSHAESLESLEGSRILGARIPSIWKHLGDLKPRTKKTHSEGKKNTPIWISPKNSFKCPGFFRG